jgi:hypothetical protein
MTRTLMRVGGLMTAALGAVLIGPAPPAAARQVDPAPSDTRYTECTVEAGVTPVSQPGVAPASPPAADPYPPIFVCTVEVAVPTPIAVPDRVTEMLHLGVAAALGGALAAASTAARRRRGRTPPPNGPAGGPLADRLIDITDTVQSGSHDWLRGSHAERSLPVDAHEHRASRA